METQNNTIVIQRKDMQETAKLIHRVCCTYDEISEHKRGINFLLSLSNKKPRYEVSSDDTFKFESFEIDYLKATLHKLLEESRKLEDEHDRRELEIDSDDYK